MIRISKLTDYAILILSGLAAEPDVRASAPQLARENGLPEPTVGKILRTLARAGVVDAQRGAHGGYALARDPQDVTVAEVIEAFEGPIALTECLSTETPACDVEPICQTRANWDRINQAIRRALEDIPLSEMARPQRGWSARMSAALLAPEPPPGGIA